MNLNNPDISNKVNMIKSNIKIKIIKGKEEELNIETIYNPTITNYNSSGKKLSNSNSSSKNSNETFSFKNLTSSPSRFRIRKDSLKKSVSTNEKLINSPTPIVKKNRFYLESPDFKYDFKSNL